MSDFTPIQTQEDFDKAIQKRLERKEKEVTEQFKDYISPDDFTAKQAEWEKKITEAQDAVKAAEDKLKEESTKMSDLTLRAEKAESSLLKNKIAYDNKLPLELASRLVGNNEEELKKDAETLAGLIKPSHTPPLHTHEAGGSSGTGNINAGMMGLLSQLKDSME